LRVALHSPGRSDTTSGDATVALDVGTPNGPPNPLPEGSGIGVRLPMMDSMSSENSFHKGAGGVAAFDQQQAAALGELREASSFMLVVAEPTGDDGEMQTRVLAASRDGLLGAACCVRALEFSVETLQVMQAQADGEADSDL
jgi:hypothetical protein